MPECDGNRVHMFIFCVSISVKRFPIALKGKGRLLHYILHVHYNFLYTCFLYGLLFMVDNTSKKSLIFYVCRYRIFDSSFIRFQCLLSVIYFLDCL